MEKKIDFKQILDAISSFISGLTSKGVIGVDIGQNAIKIAEVERKGKAKYEIKKFIYKYLPEGCLIEDDILRPGEIQKILADCFKEKNITNKNVCIGLSGANTVSKKIQVIDGSDSEIADQVLWESEQYIPFGIDDSTVSFSILAKNSAGAAEVMMAAVKNSVADTFEQLIKDADLKLKIIDLDVFALANIYEVAVGNNDEFEGGVLLIDFGAQKTSLVIINHKVTIFTREMPVGGGIITEEIQRQMALSYEDAENIKIAGDENGNLPQEVVDIMTSNIDTILSEIKKTLNFFISATTEVTIGKCYITGGASLTPGITEGIEQIIGVKPEFINPFVTFSCNEKKFGEELMDYIASSGNIALGLAIRNLRR